MLCSMWVALSKIIIIIISVVIFVISTVPCPALNSAVYHVSSEPVSLHLDTPAGEVEKYIVTTCWEDYEERKEKTTSAFTSE